MSESPIPEADNPYAAPQADEDTGVDAAPAPPREAGYRDQTTFAKVVVAFLVVQAVTNLVNAAICFFPLAQLDESTQATAIAASQAAATFVNFCFWLGALAFFSFLVRANKNARSFERATHDVSDEASAAFGTLGRFTPASMVWWYFVPLANLVYPYRAVHAVWAASAPESADISSALRSGVLNVWWGTWLAGSIWQRVSSASLGIWGTGTAASNALVGLGAAIAAVSCWAAQRMVWTLQQRQTQRSRELWR
jgi:hypothetical protein